MITVSELTKTYDTGGGISALDGVSFNIRDGELVFIMGKSGSGKSTLLNMLGGLDKPTSGSVKYDDTEITGLSEDRLCIFRRDNIGFVFQDYDLIPELTAEENIKYPVLLAKKKVDEKLFAYLVRALDLGDRLSHLPSQLSGGQQQRAAIARALVSSPGTVLCDEPTGSLDSGSAAAVRDILLGLGRELCKTIIIVTHDSEFAKSGGRIIRLKDGKIE